MGIEAIERIRQVTESKIRARAREIERYIWTEPVPIADVAMCETMEHLDPAKARRLDFKPAADGIEWGQPWSTAWFRLRARVPAAFRGEPVALRFQPGGEGLVFRNLEPIHGLDVNRDAVLLFPRARGGETIDLLVETGCNERVGVPSRRRMKTPCLTVLNREVQAASAALNALVDMLDDTFTNFFGRRFTVGQGDDTRRSRLVFELNRAVDVFDYRDTTRAGLRASARRLRRALAPLYASPAVPSAQTMACIGHAHIDVAWLWPLSETIRKCGRSFANVLALMDEYPDFQFVQSQPHLYEFTRQRYPSLFRRIKQKARRGQWHATGAMWVESDCNVTSGESLVRQIQHGMRYFQREFNRVPRCLWLPDVFGYSGALPQILKGFGIPYFLTQKISWNQFTEFPYHSFWWEGIDGTTVLTHFPPISNYNSGLASSEVRMAERRYQEKDRSPIQMIPFGHGDGGGGPTREHIERLRHYRNLEGMPRLEAMDPEVFFDRLERESRDLPRWVGELYLELHRGTLTSQARNKRYNRQCELRLRGQEFLSACNLAAGGAYPARALDALWKTVLLNQFHDIIPGSSITKVYEDSTRDYEGVLQGLDDLDAKALARYVARVDTRGAGQAVVAMNALSWECQAPVAVAAPASVAARGALVAAPAGGGTPVPVQRGADGQLRFLAALPAMGHAVYHLRAGETPADGAVQVDPRGLENDLLKVVLDARGRLVRVFDKRHGRDVLAPGAIGNQLQLFEDKPVDWDAWDIDYFFKEKMLECDGALESIDVLESGPVRGVLRVTRRLSRSRVIQDLVLYAGSPRLDFETVVEWGDENRVLLKVAFPVQVHSESARFEIQFGNIVRPTHDNQPQDRARFEVTGHKWVDLSETDYGVALLNDCKYGHDVRGGVMRLSLLRAPKDPDPVADINQTHRFTFALWPHAGDFTQGVVRAGYELNVPPRAAFATAHRGVMPPAASRFGVSSPHVILDTVKGAEDGRALILRLYEAHGARGACTVRTDLPVKSWHRADLNERPLRALSARNGAVRLMVRPYEIITLRLEL